MEITKDELFNKIIGLMGRYKESDENKYNEIDDFLNNITLILCWMNEDGKINLSNYNSLKMLYLYSDAPYNGEINSNDLSSLLISSKNELINKTKQDHAGEFWMTRFCDFKHHRNRITKALLIILFVVVFIATVVITTLAFTKYNNDDSNFKEISLGIMGVVDFIVGFFAFIVERINDSNKNNQKIINNLQEKDYEIKKNGSNYKNKVARSEDVYILNKTKKARNKVIRSKNIKIENKETSDKKHYM